MRLSKFKLQELIDNWINAFRLESLVEGLIGFVVLYWSCCEFALDWRWGLVGVVPMLIHTCIGVMDRRYRNERYLEFILSEFLIIALLFIGYYYAMKSCS